MVLDLIELLSSRNINKTKTIICFQKLFTMINLEILEYLVLSTRYIKLKKIIR